MTLQIASRFAIATSLTLFACSAPNPPTDAMEPSDAMVQDTPMTTIDATVEAAVDVVAVTDVIVDREAPEISLDDSGPELWVPNRRVRVRGSVRDADARITLAVRIGTTTLPTVMNAATLPAFDLAIDAPRGVSTLELRATDSSGNSATVTLTLHRGNDVAAGLSHSAALRSGDVFTWGGNYDNELGRTVARTDAVPAAISMNFDGAELTSLHFTSGGASSFALDARGRVWSWGPSGMTPTRVEGLENVAQLAISSGHRLALLEDGTVRAWGTNAAGQLGTGDTMSRAEPTTIASLTRVVSICVGSQHSAAVTDDGTVWVFGANNNGQLGQGAVDSSAHSAPAPVEPLPLATAVACGNSHTLALLEDSGVFAWGNGTSGQIGNGAGATSVVPSRVSALARVRNVAAGGNTSWAIDRDGQLFAFGQNSSGQLAIGVSAGRNAPVPVAMLTDVRSVSPGGSHTILRASDGRVWAAGSNGSMQLAREAGSSYLPIEVTLP